MTVSLYVLYASVGVAAVIAIAALAVVLFLWKRSRAGRREAPSENLTIDISQLEAKGPPDHGPQLELYGISMRMAVLVIAPLGRHTELPDKEAMREAMAALSPHFPEVLDHHRPIFRRWPTQLSAHGFPRAFFTNLQLPGQKGRGTPWCSVTGRFIYGQGVLLVGMVLCATQPNPLDQIELEQHGQLRDLLKIHASV